jgi:FAD/FMN-containing dehydrogenase
MSGFRNRDPGVDQGGFLAHLSAIVGAPHVLRGEDAAPFCTDWRRLFTGDALAVLRPANTAQVAACVVACAEAGVAVVPQGGNTGLCGGATPLRGQVVLSLGRLDRIRDIDAADLVMEAEAGVTLQAARTAAAEAGLDLPLGIASEGSAQLGGVLATNAGGTATLRHGTARELALGLEVVLADGRIWSGLRRLRKDNTGYALTKLFVGSEGTLGIITAACLRLVPAARTREVAFASLPSAEAVLGLLGLVRRAGDGALAAYEYISGAALRLALAHIRGLADPLADHAAHYVLVELSSPRPEAPLAPLLESVLAEALEAGLITDAVLAASDAQRAALWRLRESLTEAQQRAGPTIKNDISVPISRIADFLRAAHAACTALAPSVQSVPFGHAGDGNIHFNLMVADAQAQGPALMHAVGEVARCLGGSFSAEHGIGQLKTGLLAEWRAGVEMDLFHAIKHALDPKNLLNPEKLLFGPHQE